MITHDKIKELRRNGRNIEANELLAQYYEEKKKSKEELKKELRRDYDLRRKKQ